MNDRLIKVDVVIKDFVRGLAAYADAWGTIVEYRLYKYILYSGFIGLLIFMILGGAMWSYSGDLSDWLVSLIPWDYDIVTSISRWLIRLLSASIFLILYKHLVLIFTAPVMSILSDRVESELYDVPADQSVLSFTRVIRELFRGATIALRSFLREMMYTVLLFILGLFPGLGIITSPMIFVVQSYYAGYGNHDFWAERHFSYRGTVSFMGRQKGMLTANGLVFLTLLLIPIAGVFLAPPLATVAATIHGLEKLSVEE